jgi:hypothetical protein
MRPRTSYRSRKGISFRKKSKTKLKTRDRLRHRTKKFKGGSFFSDATYLMQKVSNVFSSNPQVPYGNVSTPVPPFSYFQNI